MSSFLRGYTEYIRLCSDVNHCFPCYSQKVNSTLIDHFIVVFDLIFYDLKAVNVIGFALAIYSSDSQFLRANLGF